MNKEEKEAIEFFEKSFKKKIPPYWYDDTISNIEEKIKTVLNLIQKQEKIIDKMAEQLAGLTIWNDNIEEALILGDKQEVKEYFKKVVDEDGKKEKI